MIKIKRFASKRRSRKYNSKKRFKVNPLKENILRDWSLKVRERDSFQCLNCSSSKKVHAHHMVSKYYMPKYAYTLYNGITLCKKCHLGYGGVHHKKSKPSSPLIRQLRRIYKMNDIYTAKVLQRKLQR